MDNNLLKHYAQRLIKYGAIDTWQEIETTTEEIPSNTEQCDKSDIGTTPSGTRYIKSLVNQYLTDKGYPFTPENVELVAKMFQASDNGYIRKNVNKITRNEIDDLKDEDLDTFLQIKLLEHISKLQKEICNQQFMDYKVEKVNDNFRGGTDTSQLSNLLNDNSRHGWRLKHVYTNELGKNSSSVTIGSVTSGTNSTIDQTILIFERPAYLNDRTAREIYNELHNI